MLLLLFLLSRNRNRKFSLNFMKMNPKGGGAETNAPRLLRFVIGPRVQERVSILSCSLFLRILRVDSKALLVSYDEESSFPCEAKATSEVNAACFPFFNV